MASITYGFPRNVVLVAGSEYYAMKQLRTLTFTKSWSTADIESSSTFILCVLTCEPWHIRTSFDCDNARLILRLGLPASLLHLVQ